MSAPGKKAYIIFRFPIPVRLPGLTHLTVLEFSIAVCRRGFSPGFPIGTLLHPLLLPSLAPVTVLRSSNRLTPTLDETARTFSPTATNTPAKMSDKEFTYQDVAEHNTKKDLFVVIHDKVYDCAKFIDEHP